MPDLDSDGVCANPGLGQTQCLHQLHVLFYRSVIEEQGRYIRDLERRLAGQPITRVWLNGVLQR